MAQNRSHTTNRRVRDADEPADSTTGDASAVYGEGKLHRAEVERYSRQMMLPEVGSAGTRALLDAHVLIVGAGGLGSTSAMYLAAAGVGHLTLVDFDRVDRSNLHRQVIHADDRVGVNKAVSARATLLALNPTISVTAVEDQFTAENGLALVQAASLVVDATDNVAARYMINDACVLAGKPLVSGSAMRWEGQITVYHYNGGPCYRCVFPEPPPPATVGSCDDSGVVGAMPGAIGCLQALEAQKILMPAAAAEGGVLAGRMLFVDGLRGGYRMMRMRPRQPHCRSCGTPDESQGHGAKITSLASVGAAYEAGACGRVPNTLPAAHRVAPDAAAQLMGLVTSATSTSSSSSSVPAASSNVNGGGESGAIVEDKQKNVLVLDVRNAQQYNMCALPGAVNVPLAHLVAAEDPVALVAERAGTTGGVAGLANMDVFVHCRRGNASVTATQVLLRTNNNDSATGDVTGQPARWCRTLRNVDGGLAALVRTGSIDFPEY